MPVPNRKGAHETVDKARARDLETRSPETAREFPYSLFVAGYAMVYGAILVAMTLYDVAGAP